MREATALKKTASNNGATTNTSTTGGGNLVEKIVGIVRWQTFTYDSENRLVKTETMANSQVESTSSYQYDSLGRRVAKQWEIKGQTDRKRFLWQGLRLLREESPGQSSLYLYEPGSYAPLARIDEKEGEVENKVYYFHTDQIGTPLEMTDAEGQIVWQAKYRPWGAIEKLVVNEVEQNLRFQGQYFDVETGLHYNTFRYYDPEIGRFITQDPIGLAGGVNLYQYAPNPIRWTDALGWACELFRGVSANHPAIDDAKRGVARPGKIDSDISPASHNGGDVSDISSYTSWTKDLEIAKWWANRQGPGGVILGTPTGAPKPGDTWRWEFSPDEYGESEILLKGIRDKLQVFTPDEL